MIEPGDAFADVRAMILDDNRTFQNLLRTMLRQLGFRRIDVFDDPAEARAHAGRSVVEIAFVDLVMPGQNGIDWVRAARRSRLLANPNMAIVMVTGHARLHVCEKALAAGVDDFLVKPFSPNALLRHVSRTLGRPHPYVSTVDGYFGPDILGHRALAGAPERGDEFPGDARASSLVTPWRRRRPRFSVPGLDVGARPPGPHTDDQTFLD